MLPAFAEPNHSSLLDEAACSRPLKANDNSVSFHDARRFLLTGQAATVALNPRYDQVDCQPQVFGYASRAEGDRGPRRCVPRFGDKPAASTPSYGLRNNHSQIPLPPNPFRAGIRIAGNADAAVNAAPLFAELAPFSSRLAARKHFEEKAASCLSGMAQAKT